MFWFVSFMTNLSLYVNNFVLAHSDETNLTKVFSSRKLWKIRKKDPSIIEKRKKKNENFINKINRCCSKSRRRSGKQIAETWHQKSKNDLPVWPPKMYCDGKQIISEFMGVAHMGDGGFWKHFYLLAKFSWIFLFAFAFPNRYQQNVCFACVEFGKLLA